MSRAQAEVDDAPTTGRTPAASAVGATAYRRAPGARPGPRSARLVLRRMAPLSVLRWALATSVAMIVVLLATVTTLYALLDAMGVFSSVGRTLHDLGLTHSTTISALPAVLTWTTIAAAGLACLFTIVVTVGSVLFNVVNDVVGGPEVTLAERR